MSRRAIEILLVEDNLGDARLTQEALRESAGHCRLRHVRDGVEALAYLRREAPFASALRPDLILLDLNLPRKDGLEVLAEIKTDDRLRRIPVIVLSASESEDDILRAYDLKTNCFVSKPPGLDEFIAAIRSIAGFWLAVVKLPVE